MRNACSAVLIFCLAAAALAQTPPPVKFLSAFDQAVISREKALIEARRKDDNADLKRMLAEDFTLVGVDGKMDDGPGAAEGLGGSDLDELTPYNFKVVSAGDGFVIVTYEAIVGEKPQEDQGPPPRYQHLSSVWVKHGGEWKLQFHQTTPMHWGDW